MPFLRPDTTAQPEKSCAPFSSPLFDLKEGGDYGHYASYVKALPASILQNGLGQSLATLLAAAKGNAADPHRLLYDHVNQWWSAPARKPPLGTGDSR